MIRRIPVLPTLIVLAAIAVMVRLGFWQLDRLHQKEALLGQYESAKDLPEVTDLNTFRLIDYPTPFTRVHVKCDSIIETATLAGRNLAEEAGWAHHVKCNYRGPSGGGYERRIIAGWSRDFAPRKFAASEVTGTVVPDKGADPLFWHIVADPPLAGLEANAKPDPTNIPNNHLSYAVQWFLFALTALVIYALALRKRLQSGREG
jgi:surfeit locus 1 family protein